MIRKIVRIGASCQVKETLKCSNTLLWVESSFII